MKRFLLTLTAIVLLRVFLIPSLWLAAGMVAMIWIRSFLQLQFPAHKKVITAVLMIVLVSVAAPHIYQIIAPYNARTEIAAERRWLFWDLWRAEEMDPAVLKSRLELSEQLQWLEDRVGEEHETALARIRADYTAHRITTEEAWHRTQRVQEESKVFQAKTDKMSRLITSDDTGEPRPQQQSRPAPPQPSMTVAIQPNQWSDWITLPPTAKFSSNAPGWQEFGFRNGERILVKENGEIIHTSPRGQRTRLIKFPSMIPSKTFRLRGQAGNAVITITG